MGAIQKLKSSEEVVLDYIVSLKKHYQSGSSTEHSYRGNLEGLMSKLNPDIMVINEPKRIKCGAPDYIVKIKNTPLGYIETKDIGEKLDKAEKSKQLIKYFDSLSNLILTNYLEFRWYVKGELRLKVNLAKKNKKGIILQDEEVGKFLNLIDRFFSEETFTVHSAANLTERLAGNARNVKELILNSFNEEEDSIWLYSWLEAFKKALVKDIDKELFSDMFAQTMVYGFFAARVHSAEEQFSRLNATQILPKTNPFLRKLFYEFAGLDMPDSFNWAVDEIVELLKRTDIKKILEEFYNKQEREDPVIHFYESFLNSYNSKLQKRRGVYYTPSPIVNYIVNSVDCILKSQFNNNGLADDKALVLDPATGTASFLQQVIKKIKSKYKKNDGLWDAYVSGSLLERIFGFEILMAPYAIAHLKLGLQLKDTGYTFKKNQRLGIYLTNTLEQIANKSQEMVFKWISAEADAATEIKREKPIMVVLGNPPYRGESANQGEWITNLMRGYDTITKTKTTNYFELDNKPLGEKNPKWLNDDYVKFIRFGEWRIEQTGHGVLAFITNHSFLDNPTFRGMRESLLQSFDELYLIDLHGSSKKKEDIPEGIRDENVFDIQQGVSINIFIKKKESSNNTLARVFRADLWGTKEDKYSWLDVNSIETTNFQEIKPKLPFYLFAERDENIEQEYKKGVSVKDLFIKSSVGITTGRDNLTIDFNEDKLHSKIRKFKEFKGTKKQLESQFEIKVSNEWNFKEAITMLNKERTGVKSIKPITYRPFDNRFIFYHSAVVRRTRNKIMKHMIDIENIALVSARSNKSSIQDQFFVTKFMTECKAGEASTQSAIFPLYRSIEKTPMFKGEHISNMDKYYIDKISSFLKNKYIDKILFQYMYGLFYSSQYRKRYSDFLKVDFPKVLVFKNRKLFNQISQLGDRLIKLHTQSVEKLESSSKFPQKGNNLVENIKYSITSQKLEINEKQYFSNIPPEVWSYKIGGYEVLSKFLTSREGHNLSVQEILQVIQIVEIIKQTIALSKDVDHLIESKGGFSEEKFLNLGTCPTKETYSEYQNELDNIIKLPKRKLSGFEQALLRRRVLFSYIIDKLPKDSNLARVKLAKVFYVCDVECADDFKTKYFRDVAGPLDHRLFYNKKTGLDSLGFKDGLFDIKVIKLKKGVKYIYRPTKRNEAFLKEHISEIEGNIQIFNKVIDIFSALNFEQSEIVATLYACWNDLMISKKKLTDKLIIAEFLSNWHPNKKQYTVNRLLKAIQWMREKQLVPPGIRGRTGKKRVRENIPF